MNKNYNTGIYKIINIATGKYYVGSAVNIINRIKSHFNQLSNNKHHSKKLQNSYNKHGCDKFLFETILFCKTEDLIFYEQRSINTFNSFKYGYNSSPTAGNILGYKHTEESKQKIALANSKRIHTIESRKKRSIAITGTILSKETKEKISKANKEQFSSEEGKLSLLNRPAVTKKTKFKISQSLVGNNNSKGFKHTEETKLKVSKSLTGNTRALGMNHSEETKIKISNSLKGRSKSESTKEAMRLTWARKKAEKII